MSKNTIRIAAERNVQRLYSVDTIIALGKLPFEELETLDTNLHDRLAQSNHQWKDERLMRDIDTVAGEFNARLGGEAA